MILTKYCPVSLELLRLELIRLTLIRTLSFYIILGVLRWNCSCSWELDVKAIHWRFSYMNFFMRFEFTFIRNFWIWSILWIYCLSSSDKWLCFRRMLIIAIKSFCRIWILNESSLKWMHFICTNCTELSALGSFVVN